MMPYASPVYRLTSLQTKNKPKTKPKNRPKNKKQPFSGPQLPRKVHLVKLSQVQMRQVQMPALNPEKSLSPIAESPIFPQIQKKV